MATRRLRRAVLVTASVVLALVVAPSPASATFPGANGDVVFSRDGRIWIGEGDGAYTERALTRGSGGQWSPDGRLIAYETAWGALATITPSGTRRVLMEDAPAAWSWMPGTGTARAIAYAVTRPDGRRAIASLTVATRRVQVLTGPIGRLRCPITDVVWGPRHYAFIDCAGLTVRQPGNPTRTVVASVTVPMTGDTARVVPGELEFMADQRTLFFDLEETGGCFEYWGAFDTATGRSDSAGWDYSHYCEGNDHTRELAPNPAGGFTGLWTEHDVDGPGWYVLEGYARVPIGGGTPWQDIDIQPLPAG